MAGMTGLGKIQVTLSLAHIFIIIELCFSSCFPSSQKLWGEFSRDLECNLSMKVLVAQSCPTLCDLMDCSPPGSSAYGMSQARILEEVAISFPKGSSRPRGSNPSLLRCRWILYPLTHQGGFEWNHRLRICNVSTGWWDWEYSLREFRMTSCKWKMFLREDYMPPQTQGFHKRSRKNGPGGRYLWINEKHPKVAHT